MERILPKRRDFLDNQDGATLSLSELNRFILDHSVMGGTLIALALGIGFQFLPNYWQLIILAGLVPGLIVKSWSRGFVGVRFLFLSPARTSKAHAFDADPPRGKFQWHQTR